ncbi:MAG: GGDEF domain-containing protein [Curvibacter sp.]|nr:GGDEF domain-containing protein [Curvibacter sp.]
MQTTPVFLSTLPVGPRQHRLAAAIAALSLAAFMVLAPLARHQLPQVWSFIPIYETWLMGSDVITAVLLFSQYVSSRSRALQVLACGYAFSAAMTLVHALSFPGLFAPGGLIGGGAQTTAWLYMLWHGGFPIFVAVYSVLRDAEEVPEKGPGRSPRSLWLSLAAVMTLVSGLAVLSTVFGDRLPEIMDGSHYTPAMILIVLGVWACGLVALMLTLRRRSRSLLDLWLSVVMCAWLIDIALSAVLNQGRYDLGFYAGRIYGLLASSFVLLVLLVESGALYGRLVGLTEVLQRLTEQDALTGLANRRHFDLVLEREWCRAARSDAPLSLLMIDVDHFKLFNDHFGHVKGDACLQSVARTLDSSVNRAGDLVARYGGEEFALLLPGTDAESALLLARRLCRVVAELALPHPNSPSAAIVTISVGVACSLSFGEGRDENPGKQAYSALVQVADQALYSAKQAGRNQAVLDA